MSNLPRLRIGHGDWLKTLRELGEHAKLGFWKGFAPASPMAVKECECKIRRSFPDDFKTFVCELGTGSFANGEYGGIYPMDDIASTACGALYTIEGAAALPEPTILEYYVSENVGGNESNIFSSRSVILKGVNRLDLIQFGWDGLGGYHQLVRNPQKYGMGYCLLTEDVDIENRQADFTSAILAILSEISRCISEKERPLAKD